MRGLQLRWAAVGFGEGIDDLDGFDGDADDLTDEADDLFGVVGAVGVGRDAAAFVGGDLVLVDDPIEGGAVSCSSRKRDSKKRGGRPRPRGVGSEESFAVEVDQVAGGLCDPHLSFPGDVGKVLHHCLSRHECGDEHQAG